MGYVVEVENGIALSNGLMLNQRGQTIMGASHWYGSFINKRIPAHKGLKISRFQNQLEQLGPLNIRPWSASLDLKHYPGTVLVLSMSYSHPAAYGHYLIESLGRLALVEDQMDLYPAVYVRHVMPYRKQYLSMLGLDNKQIISADQEMPAGITADRLVMPCFQRTYDYLIDSKILGFLRRKLLPYADSALSQGERIYVSRRKARRRRILNEQELLPILDEYGFSVICPEDCSLNEQISIFKFAKIIVSSHGSALDNLLYCDPGTKVMEIFSGSNMHVDIVYRMAVSLNLEYFYLSGEGNATKVKIHDDTNVDPNSFKRAIALLCR